MSRETKVRPVIHFLEDLKDLEDGDKVSGRIATCPACDRRFIARRDTVYCSDKCRQKANRDSRELQ